jgi:hypothetical protein
VPFPIADLIYKLRASRHAVSEHPEFLRDPQAQAFDRSLKQRWLPIASFLRAGMDTLAALAGTDKYGEHFYTPVYEEMARPHRRKPVTLLEVGVGGYSGWVGGESLHMWAAYFPKGKIYGIDVVDKTVLSRGRIKVFQCSQVDRERLTALAREIGPFDFVIDDGSHLNAHQVETFGILWPFVRDGGTYVVEDVQTSYWPSYGGGPLGTQTYQRSCMSFFKKLCDSVNVPEFLEQPGPDALVDHTIASIAFHHNMIVLTKDVTARVSNIPLDRPEWRAKLMQPMEGADR